MPTLAQFPDDLRKLLFGVPFGERFPPRPNPPPLARDGRTAALELLGEYVASLTFFRPNAPGQPPIPFRIAPEHFHVEWPDSVQRLVVAECACVVIPGPFAYDAIGLTNFVEEETRDVYARGTVLQWQSCYREAVQLEFWCPTQAHRRSIKAGFEVAMSPVEQMAGIRFVMPAYFGRPVTFSLEGGQLMDDENSARNRRRVRFRLDMRFNTVALVNYAVLEPRVKTAVDIDPDTGLAVDTSVNAPDR